MPHPVRRAGLFKGCKKLQSFIRILSRDSAITLPGIMLYIEKNQICVIQDLLISAFPASGGIQTGMNSGLPAELQTLQQKLLLQKRLPS